VADTGASEERRKRLAVYEAGRAIIAEMSNEIENVELVCALHGNCAAPYLP
jgi:DNA-binding MarR family transcriptional regulator